MDNQTTNDYQLAQYIVTNPEKGKKFDTFDANPLLQKLEAHLFGHFVSAMLSGNMKDTLGDFDTPNGFIRLLAEKADEFCPSRTMSDLLLKQEIVLHVTSQIGQSIKSTVTKQFGGGIGSAIIIEAILSRRKS